jgi:hypothetical protein
MRYTWDSEYIGILIMQSIIILYTKFNIFYNNNITILYIFSYILITLSLIFSHDYLYLVNNFYYIVF